MSNWIKTGNEWANSIFMSRYMDDPIFQALIGYLESKGILNKVEFADFVNEYCQADVKVRERIARESD